ncbi:uncharacterized protein LOC107795343 [Nicotiana tabacum]|uniref:Uncharacterized protein LOC107795343 n=8 Tax=Nicotiana tabacum TaxID=4097 RepID=A0AC58S8S4_TOBAC
MHPLNIIGKRQLELASQLQEQVQRVPLTSSSSASQAIHEQVQQATHDSTTPASQTVHEQFEDSDHHKSNEQSEEQGPPERKRKRGRTQMQSVHGRRECKLIVLNDLNQPIGPTDEVVKELGSFLGTLARKRTFCPLNVFNWRKLDTTDDMWKYIKAKYDIPGRRNHGFFIQFRLLGESIRMN